MRDALFHNSHAHLLFRKPDSSPKSPIPFRLVMASPANDSINFVITGDEDPRMDGQDDPVQEERQEDLYIHVFEGQSVSSALRAEKREHMTEATNRDDEDCAGQRRSLI